MAKRLQLCTYEDWYSLKICCDSYYNFFPYPLPQNKSAGAFTSHSKPLQLKEGELEKIKAKQKEVFENAVDSHFNSLKTDFSQRLLRTNDFIGFIEETYKSLHSLLNDSFLDSGPLSKIKFYDFGYFRFKESKISQIRNAVNLLDEVTDLTKYHPNQYALFVVPSDDIIEETHALLRFYSWIDEINSAIIFVINKIERECLFNFKDSNPVTPLSLINKYLDKHFFNNFIDCGNSLSTTGFELNDIKLADLLHLCFIEKHLEISKAQLSNYILEHTSERNSSTLLTLLRKTNKILDCLDIITRRFLLYKHQQDVIDNTKTRVLINHYRHHLSEYPDFNSAKISPHYTFRSFEDKILSGFYDLDLCLSNRPFDDNSTKTCIDYKVECLEKYKIHFESFFENWLASRKLKTSDSNKIKFIEHAIDHIQKHYLNYKSKESVGIQVSIHSKEYVFSSSFYSSYVIQLFEKINEFLNLELSTSKKNKSTINHIFDGYKNDIVTLNSLIRANFNSDSEYEKMLKNLHTILIKKYQRVGYKSVIDDIDFESFKTHWLNPVNQPFKFLWPAKCLRFLIHNISVKISNNEWKKWEEAACLFLDKNGKLFEVRKLQTSNGPLTKHQLTVLNLIIKTLQL